MMLQKRGLQVALIGGLSSSLAYYYLSSSSSSNLTMNAPTDRWVKAWEKYKGEGIKPGFHLDKANPVLVENMDKLFPNEAAKKGGVFVPLCGKTLDMMFLADYVDVYGIECSKLAVDDFAAENNLTWDVQEGGLAMTTKNGHKLAIGMFDFFDLPPKWGRQTAKFTACFDRAAFVAIEPSLRGDYVRVLREQLDPKANILLSALEYDQSKMSGPPFSVPQEQVRTHFGKYYNVEILLEQELIANEPRFKEKGLESFKQVVYLLTPKKNANL